MALMAYSHPQVDRDSIPTDLSHFFFAPKAMTDHGAAIYGAPWIPSIYPQSC